MAGYKVMLRVLAIIIVLGIIGFGIFYFVAGGFSNAKASYSVYKTITKSSENEYMQTINDSKIDLLGAYGVDGIKFKKYYDEYKTFDYIIKEMGEELYFAPKNSSGKKDFDGKYDAYFSALKKAYSDFQVFETSYSSYTSENSAGGETITPWEEKELQEFAPMVFSSTQNLAQKAFELSGASLNFVTTNCLGGNTYGIFKYTMLNALNGQAEVLFLALCDGKAPTSINAYANDTKNALQKYKNEKASNFANELNASSIQFNFKHCFYSLSLDELNSCYQSTNKSDYINALTGNNKQAMQTTCQVMGWI